jgi:hypothetical protein
MRLGRLSRFVALACLLLASLTSRSDIGRANRIGIYIWGALPSAADPLVVAAEDARSLGVRVVRTCISPYWDPRPNAPDRLARLGQKVLRSDYQGVLKCFPVVMLTAYDAASYDARYRGRKGLASDDAWRAMLAEVREEFRRFTLELSKLPNTYIITNWEAENDGTPERWDDYLAYLQARLDGIAAGRREAQAARYPAHIFTAVEFTHVRSGYADPRTPAAVVTASGLDAALALGGVDYLSYSAWESVFHTADRTYTVAKLREAFGVIGTKRRARSSRCRLIVGEVGYLRDYDPDNWNLDMILTECLRSQFGKFDLSRKITSQGAFFRGLLQGAASRR